MLKIFVYLNLCICISCNEENTNENKQEVFYPIILRLENLKFEIILTGKVLLSSNESISNMSPRVVELEY